jgi:formiminotetrahydrofolate cyclodeaminase
MKALPSEISIRDFLAAVASAEGAHGAVSAAAVAGGVGASLLAMVAALPQTRSDSADDRTELVRAATALGDVQERLIGTLETETAVRILAARSLPQTSEVLRTERQAAIQLALRAAADVPLEVMRLCARALRLGHTVAAHGARAAAADVQLAVSLLHAAFSGAQTNLEGKLATLTDTPYITSVIDDVARLSEEATAAARAAESILRMPQA